MLDKDRPMASLIILVSRAPDVPTRVPATTRTRFCRAKPSAATANPVRELSKEMRTGASAPPTGRQIPTPRARATRPRTTKPDRWGSAIVHAPTPMSTMTAPACTYS